MLGFCAPCVAAAGGSALLAPFERVRDGAAAVVNIPRERRAFLESLFRELEALKPGDSYEAVQRSLLTLILAEVNRAMAEAGQRTARGGGVVVDALRFIERNCLRSITRRSLYARACGAVPRAVPATRLRLSRSTRRSVRDAPGHA
jgi:hypothetical protein